WLLSNANMHSGFAPARGFRINDNSLGLALLNCKTWVSYVSGDLSSTWRLSLQPSETWSALIHLSPNEINAILFNPRTTSKACRASRRARGRWTQRLIGWLVRFVGRRIVRPARFA